MNITKGDVFWDISDGVDLVVKKVMNDMVVLQSRDGKRQVLTGMITLASQLLYQKKLDERS